jgi:hypothetical protein
MVFVVYKWAVASPNEEHGDLSRMHDPYICIGFWHCSLVVLIQADLLYSYGESIMPHLRLLP